MLKGLPLGALYWCASLLALENGSFRLTSSNFSASVISSIFAASLSISVGDFLVISSSWKLYPSSSRGSSSSSASSSSCTIRRWSFAILMSSSSAGDYPLEIFLLLPFVTVGGSEFPPSGSRLFLLAGKLSVGALLTLATG